MDGGRIGGGVFRSLLEPRARSLVHARGAPLMCRLHRVLANSLPYTRASVVTRAPRRNREIAFFLSPTLAGEPQKVALPEKSRPFSRAASRRAAVTNFDLDSPEGSGRKRETRRRERRNIDYGRSFRGLGRARWKWRFCTRERDHLPSLPLRY